MLGPPAVAVTDAAVHVPPITDGVATVIPAGNVSVNAALSVPAVALVFPNVSVSVDVPPLAIVLGLKPFPIVGAAAIVVEALHAPAAQVGLSGPVAATVLVSTTPAVITLAVMTTDACAPAFKVAEQAKLPPAVNGPAGQPGPATVIVEMLLGSVSVRTTGPVVGPVPVFWAVMVHVTVSPI